MSEKRTTKVTEDDANNIKKLGKLNSKIEAAQAELRALQVEASECIESLSSSLKEGTYQAGSWVCIVKDKLIKGRESPSWKAVATTIKKGVDLIKYELAQKHPEHTSAFDKMSKRIHKLYDDTLVANTTIGEDKINTTVEVSKAKK